MSGSNSLRESTTKKPCEYGTNCYRRNKLHFQQFSHSHLEMILQEIGSGDIVIPNSCNPKTSKETLEIQLNILREISNEDLVSEAPIVNDSNPSDVKASIANIVRTNEMRSLSKPKSGTNCPFGEACLRRHPEHFKEFKHPHLESFFHRIGGSSITIETVQALNSSLSAETLKMQLEILRSLKVPGSLGQASSSGQKRPQNSHELETQAKQARIVVMDRVKYNILDKIEISQPYCFFLSTISDSTPTHTEMLSVTLVELLDPRLGDLESSLQINFMVQLGWLLAQYIIMGHRCKPLTLLYGDIDEVPGDKMKFITAVKVIPPSPFGTHHTKMMVLSYTDGSIRIVVSTANLVESDWDNTAQGLWISPKCPRLPDDANTMEGESPTRFKMSLLRYLNAYKVPELATWINRITQADLSAINVFFIASVPGVHARPAQWGQCALANVLAENLVIPENNSYTVIAQCSSIGSLGPRPDLWLMGDMLRTFCSGEKKGLTSYPSLKLIYPTFSNIESGYDGILGGGCIPYTKKTHDKQPWLFDFMCKWKSEARHRTRAPPHIKTYCRISPDWSKMSYFLLTSANLSKAAWGQLSKSGSLNILSYEGGVLFLPQYMIEKDYFPLKESEGGPIFPLPYDVPLDPYTPEDTPWFLDNIC